jgi:hypothetical protein
MRKILALGIATALIFSTPAAFSVTPKVGGTCTKINQFYESKSIILVCAVAKGKKLWRIANSQEKGTYLGEKDRINAAAVAAKNAAAAAAKCAADKFCVEKEKLRVDKAAIDVNLSEICAVGDTCKIGNTGPGGGIVFYDAGSQQSWGRYLEVAPNGWSGGKYDPNPDWCTPKNNQTNAIQGPRWLENLGTEIGTGLENTNYISTFCSEGAGPLAKSYSGGGKNDWFLPSKDELNELCKYVFVQPTGDSKVRCKQRVNFQSTIREGFLKKFYFSSSIVDPYIWAIAFDSGYGVALGEAPNVYSREPSRVRPIRAF